ncbi:MAG: hypothetical protein KDC35_10885 [Acidobacteria bacterium]|nr:hypothetical protein [Acidobacteriota bacterium]
MLRPSDSSGPSGSGVEIRDAYYRGILVFKRAHAPILNVDYDPGGCGCFRDWSNSERSFAMDNPLATPGFYEPTSNAETVCDNANSLTTPPGDCPWKVGQECHTGVAIEKSAERILITSQMQAGWYRYTMRWEFYVDGTIRPTFGFGVYNTSCSSASHRHHNYWRFDFDIDDAGNDFVQEVEGGVPNVFANEVTRTWTGASTAWEVYDASSGRGYRITPGSGDLDLPADAFSKLDFMASLYKAGELSDSGGGCAINEGTIANGESITNTDVVLWYRAGVHDVVGSNIFKCKAGGPILEPIGDWNMCGPDPGNLYPKWHSADIDYDYNTNGVVDVADYASLVNNDCIGP